MTLQTASNAHSFSFVERVERVVHRYLAVRQTRQQLAVLSDHLLDDIGVTRADLDRIAEGRKLSPVAAALPKTSLQTVETLDLKRAA